MDIFGAEFDYHTLPDKLDKFDIEAFDRYEIVTQSWILPLYLYGDLIGCDQTYKAISICHDNRLCSRCRLMTSL